MEDQPSTPTNQNDRVALGWFALGVVVGAVAASAAALLITAARTPSTNVVQQRDANAQVLTDAQPFVPKVALRPQNTQGDAAARVTIVEYSDFNCGFCRRFHDQTFQQLVDTYVKTGQARISYKHYPFLTPSSAWKAEAAECAAEQNRFWEYHAMLFATEIDGQNESEVKRALTAAAVQLGLSEPDFTRCLSDGEARRRVEADAAEGQQLGVTGTPSFLINGRPLVGAQPFEAFKKMIDAELAQTP